MKILIDADACPGAIKDICYRAAERKRIPLILVANMPLNVPKSERIQFVHVPDGPDVADAKIVEMMTEGDLVITADIPLAGQVVEKGGAVIDHRGELLSEENIGQRLSIRNFMAELRSGGVDTGGPAAFSQRDKQNFANQLDRFLTKYA